MRKLPLFVVMLVASATGALAQSSSYKVDTLDLPNAVQIQTPKIEAAKPPKRLTKSSNYTYTPPAGALIHLTSQQTNPSLAGFTTGNSDVDNFIVESGKRNSVD